MHIDTTEETQKTKDRDLNLYIDKLDKHPFNISGSWIVRTKLFKLVDVLAIWSESITVGEVRKTYTIR